MGLAFARLRAAAVLLLIAGFLSAIVYDAAPSRAATRPLRLLYPSSGTIINDGTAIQAQFRSPLFHPGPRDRVSFTYSTGSGAPKRILGPPLDDLGPLSVMWDTSRLAGGEYVVSASFRKGRETFRSAPVRVIVNAEPSALITGSITGITPRQGGVSARTVTMALDSNATDQDGTLSSVEWDFGDGTTGSGSTANHSYPPGNYKVTVTATDDKGGVFTSMHDLTVSDDGEGVSFQLHKTETCGCRSMTIRTTGEAEGGVAFESRNPYADLRELGPYPDQGTQLDLQQAKPRVRCRFQVVAELTPGSAPWRCAEGMRYQVTDQTFETMSAGPPVPLTSDARYDSSKSADDPYSSSDGSARETGYCAFLSAFWCDAGFHGGGDSRGRGERGVQPPDARKSHEGSRIYMLDHSVADPHSDFITDDGGASYNARYNAKISGPGGTCECTWTVLIEVDENGVLTRNEVTDVTCSAG
jgi:hypothetical protein